MAKYVPHLVDRARVVRNKNADRDTRMNNIKLVRSGNPELVFRGMFPDDWPKPIVANFIDVVGQDTAEMVGVLPTLSAAGDSTLNESTRNKQDKLSKIINYITFASNLGTNLVPAADRMNSYGFVPLVVEPNYGEQRPHIHVADSIRSYYEKDRWDRVSLYFQVFRKRTTDLIAMFPEHEGIIRKKAGYRGASEHDPWMDVNKMWTPEGVFMFLPERDGLLLSAYENPMGRIPVAIAERPTLDGEQRGAFDDVLWVFAAKAKLALLSLDATQKAVEAPIALPNDVQEMAFGPDALLRSANPERIRRVPLDLPQSTIIEGRLLDEELKFGARFPEARSGNMDASVVTGRGVQALMGGFDARIKSAQAMLGAALADALSIALEMDETIWPDVKKEVSASANGTPFELTYTPSRDIKGNYTVTQEYGVLAGLDPNRALVWGLQALGAGLTSKSFIRRNLSVNMNVTEEEKVIDVERLRESTLTAVQAYAQAIPQLATQGQDPLEAIERISKVIKARKKGTAIEEAVADAFQPKTPPADQMQPPGPEMGMNNGMPGEAPGGGGASIDIPNEPPDMMQLLSSLSGSGQPQTAVRQMRQQLI